MAGSESLEENKEMKELITSEEKPSKNDAFSYELWVASATATVFVVDSKETVRNDRREASLHNSEIVPRIVRQIDLKSIRDYLRSIMTI